MLKRLLIIVLLFGATPALADADRVRDFVVRELREDGYREIRMSRTWLGRMRFVAERPGARREIVVNPTTGAILRDYIIWLGDDDDHRRSGGGGTGGGFDDDEDDDDEDDEDDEEDEEDNSGPGNSDDDDEEDDKDNSGPGNSDDD